eukprot:TRINITY_DN57876_c0_g1_i1.p1 TRINITY_DN57876_c0_g1~~TRINITY_DN57876_c0_g1_i1.p1  ORF type:complete len:2698 (-),score=489.26 TRINITY_DN57876_c0_g1_i1:579-7559(-)
MHDRGTAAGQSQQAPIMSSLVDSLNDFFSEFAPSLFTAPDPSASFQKLQEQSFADVEQRLPRHLEVVQHEPGAQVQAPGENEVLVRACFNSRVGQLFHDDLVPPGSDLSKGICKAISDEFHRHMAECTQTGKDFFAHGDSAYHRFMSEAPESESYRQALKQMVHNQQFETLRCNENWRQEVGAMRQRLEAAQIEAARMPQSIPAEVHAKEARMAELSQQSQNLLALEADLEAVGTVQGRLDLPPSRQFPGQRAVASPDVNQAVCREMINVMIGNSSAQGRPVSIQCVLTLEEGRHAITYALTNDGTHEYVHFNDPNLGEIAVRRDNQEHLHDIADGWLRDTYGKKGADGQVQDIQHIEVFVVKHDAGAAPGSGGVGAGNVAGGDRAGRPIGTEQSSQRASATAATSALTAREGTLAGQSQLEAPELGASQQVWLEDMHAGAAGTSVPDQLAARNTPIGRALPVEQQLVGARSGARAEALAAGYVQTAAPLALTGAGSSAGPADAALAGQTASSQPQGSLTSGTQSSAQLRASTAASASSAAASQEAAARPAALEPSANRNAAVFDIEFAPREPAVAGTRVPAAAASLDDVIPGYSEMDNAGRLAAIKKSMRDLRAHPDRAGTPAAKLLHERLDAERTIEIGIKQEKETRANVRGLAAEGRLSRALSAAFTAGADRGLDNPDLIRSGLDEYLEAVFERGDVGCSFSERMLRLSAEVEKLQTAAAQSTGELRAQLDGLRQQAAESDPASREALLDECKKLKGAIKKKEDIVLEPVRKRQELIANQRGNNFQEAGRALRDIPKLTKAQWAEVAKSSVIQLATMLMVEGGAVLIGNWVQKLAGRGCRPQTRELIGLFATNGSRFLLSSAGSVLNAYVMQRELAASGKDVPNLMSLAGPMLIMTICSIATSIGIHFMSQAMDRGRLPTALIQASQIALNAGGGLIGCALVAAIGTEAAGMIASSGVIGVAGAAITALAAWGAEAICDACGGSEETGRIVSHVVKISGSVLTGALAGAVFGPVGAVVGAIVALIVGLFMLLWDLWFNWPYYEAWSVHQDTNSLSCHKMLMCASREMFYKLQAIHGEEFAALAGSAGTIRPGQIRNFLQSCGLEPSEDEITYLLDTQHWGKQQSLEKGDALFICSQLKAHRLPALQQAAGSDDEEEREIRRSSWGSRPRVARDPDDQQLVQQLQGENQAESRVAELRMATYVAQQQHHMLEQMMPRSLGCAVRTSHKGSEKTRKKGMANVIAVEPDGRQGLFMLEGSMPSPAELEQTSGLPWDHAGELVTRDPEVRDRAPVLGGPNVTSCMVAAFQLLCSVGKLSNIVDQVAGQKRRICADKPFLDLFFRTLQSVERPGGNEPGYLVQNNHATAELCAMQSMAECVHEWLAQMRQELTMQSQSQSQQDRNQKLLELFEGLFFSQPSLGQGMHEFGSVLLKQLADGEGSTSSSGNTSNTSVALDLDVSASGDAVGKYMLFGVVLKVGDPERFVTFRRVSFLDGLGPPVWHGFDGGHVVSLTHASIPFERAAELAYVLRSGAVDVLQRHMRRESVRLFPIIKGMKRFHISHMSAEGRFIAKTAPMSAVSHIVTCYPSDSDDIENGVLPSLFVVRQWMDIAPRLEQGEVRNAPTHRFEILKLSFDLQVKASSGRLAGFGKIRSLLPDKERGAFLTSDNMIAYISVSGQDIKLAARHYFPVKVQSICSDPSAEDGDSGVVVLLEETEPPAPGKQPMAMRSVPRVARYRLRNGRLQIDGPTDPALQTERFPGAQHVFTGSSDNKDFWVASVSEQRTNGLEETWSREQVEPQGVDLSNEFQQALRTAPQGALQVQWSSPGTFLEAVFHSIIGGSKSFETWRGELQRLESHQPKAQMVLHWDELRQKSRNGVCVSDADLTTPQPTRTLLDAGSDGLIWLVATHLEKPVIVLKPSASMMIGTPQFEDYWFTHTIQQADLHNGLLTLQLRVARADVSSLMSSLQAKAETNPDGSLYHGLGSRGRFARIRRARFLLVSFEVWMTWGDGADPSVLHSGLAYDDAIEEYASQAPFVLQHAADAELHALKAAVQVPQIRVGQDTCYVVCAGEDWYSTRRISQRPPAQSPGLRLASCEKMTSEVAHVDGRWAHIHQVSPGDGGLLNIVNGELRCMDNRARVAYTYNGRAVSYESLLTANGKTGAWLVLPSKTKAFTDLLTNIAEISGSDEALAESTKALKLSEANKFVCCDEARADDMWEYEIRNMGYFGDSLHALSNARTLFCERFPRIKRAAIKAASPPELRDLLTEGAHLRTAQPETFSMYHIGKNGNPYHANGHAGWDNCRMVKAAIDQQKSHNEGGGGCCVM